MKFVHYFLAICLSGLSSLNGTQDTQKITSQNTQNTNPDDGLPLDPQARDEELDAIYIRA